MANNKKQKTKLEEEIDTEMRALNVIVALSLLCAADARSILSIIPGADLLMGLTERSMESLNYVLEESLTMMQSKVENCSGCPSDPDTKRSVVEIIRSRQFEAEQYDVQTKDGYILSIQRIVNPLMTVEQRLRAKPVIMQHGLMSSSADWVINSLDVRPEPLNSQTTSSNDSQKHPNSLGFYLANRGFDVFLANSRGNIYGQRHVKLSPWEPKFWDFTFDEQIRFDLPDVIEFVQQLTNHTKVGYVGHSQGTVMMFGLLSERPEYADIVEPFIALAPVAYVSNSISPVKYFAVYTPIFEHINMWFATSNYAVKYLAPIVCGPKVVRRELCANILFLSVGFDEAELDDDRVAAYLSHTPSGTSVKNVAHYGQEVLSARFAHFDHGALGNLEKYGQREAPSYDLSRIRSKSIALFVADNDWLASPRDVQRLRSELRVQPFAVFNLTEQVASWNHIDFVYGKQAGELVNTKIEQVFSHFQRAEQEDDSADDKMEDRQ